VNYSSNQLAAPLFPNKVAPTIYNNKTSVLAFYEDYKMGYTSRYLANGYTSNSMCVLVLGSLSEHCLSRECSEHLATILTLHT